MSIKWMSVHFLDKLFPTHGHCSRFEARIEEEKAVLQCEQADNNYLYFTKPNCLTKWWLKSRVYVQVYHINQKSNREKRSDSVECPMHSEPEFKAGYSGLSHLCELEISFDKTLKTIAIFISLLYLMIFEFIVQFQAPVSDRVSYL